MKKFWVKSNIEVHINVIESTGTGHIWFDLASKCQSPQYVALEISYNIEKYIRNGSGISAYI